MKTLKSFVYVLLVFITINTNAKTKTFIREYTYNAGEADSKLSARAIALNQVKDLLFQELGSYIQSSIKIDAVEKPGAYKEFTNSQIKSMTAGIAQTKILDEKWTGETYYLKAEIKVDDEDLKERITALAKDEKKLSELERLRMQADSAFAEIERLKKELLLAKTENEKLDLQKKYLQYTQAYFENDWYNMFGNYFGNQTTNNQTAKTITQQPKIEVVFVLDATGSMGSMIANAKNKIWSIATNLAQSNSNPQLSIGLVAYRDRTDQYITKKYPLTYDMDKVYFDLMNIQAAGGGDTPESVNQALYEAVNDFQWDNSANTYKVIFLVGDAPPHMDYANDVHYQQSCKIANKKDIVINTIQCGNDYTTAGVWKQIANLTQGDYIQLTQTGSALAVVTPYDKKIAELGKELDNTRLYYGDKTKRDKLNNKKKMASTIYLSAATDEAAKRVIYNVTTAAGEANFKAENELIDEVANGNLEVKELKEEELPEELQVMDVDDREKYVAELAKKREELKKQIAELDKLRDEYIEKNTTAYTSEGRDSFNNQVFEVISKQAKKKNISTRAKAKF